MSILTLFCSSPLRCGRCVRVHQHLQTSLSPAAAAGANDLHDKNSRQGDFPHLLHNGSRLRCQHLLAGNHGGEMQHLMGSLWEVWLLWCGWIEVPLSADSQISTNWMFQGLLLCATFNWHSDPSRAWLWPVHGPHCQLLLALGVCPDASSSVYLDSACGASRTRLAELVSAYFLDSVWDCF